MSYVVSLVQFVPFLSLAPSCTDGYRPHLSSSLLFASDKNHNRRRNRIACTIMTSVSMSRSSSPLEDLPVELLLPIVVYACDYDPRPLCRLKRTCHKLNRTLHDCDPVWMELFRIRYGQDGTRDDYLHRYAMDKHALCQVTVARKDGAQLSDSIHPTTTAFLLQALHGLSHHVVPALMRSPCERARLVGTLLHLADCGTRLKEAHDSSSVMDAVLIADCFFMDPLTRPQERTMPLWKETLCQLQDAMAERCSHFTGGGRGGHFVNKIRFANHVFFNEMGFHATDESSRIGALDSSMIHKALETKTGSQLAICLLYRWTLSKVFDTVQYLQWNGCWTSTVVESGRPAHHHYIDMTTGEVHSWEGFLTATKDVVAATERTQAMKHYPSPFSAVMNFHLVVEDIHTHVLDTPDLLASKKILAAKAIVRHVVTRQTKSLEEAIVERLDIDSWWPTKPKHSIALSQSSLTS